MSLLFLVTAILALTLLQSSQHCHATNVLCASCDCKPSLEKESSVDVDCSRKGNKMVPAGSQWPHNLYKFDLSHNFIDHVTTLEPSNVSVLDLHNNYIGVIEPGVFSVFQNLQVLDLSQNRLSSLHMDTFKGLANLQVPSTSAATAYEPCQTELFNHLSRPGTAPDQPQPAEVHRKILPHEPGKP
uniref:Putative secreted protein n=1 Tax=Ixodes ricinus TaxID=34613 RepID=A0A090X819_IXORI